MTARVILDGGPLSGELHVARKTAEFVEMSVPAENGDVRFAVYRRALYLPNRFTFQGLKPTD